MTADAFAALRTLVKAGPPSAPVWFAGDRVSEREPGVAVTMTDTSRRAWG